jgi:hypothetical protein
MKSVASILVFFLLFTLISCKSHVDNESIEVDIVTPTAESELAQAISSDTTKKIHEIKEQKENLAKIEKKYGEQWGFCECVVANDSIDKAVKNVVDFETPQAEKLLERFDYVSKKCQAFLGMDANRTPEERIKHEKKVKRCLKEAGIK